MSFKLKPVRLIILILYLNSQKLLAKYYFQKKTYLNQKRSLKFKTSFYAVLLDNIAYLNLSLTKQDGPELFYQAP
jgi:hypothetical protein